MKNIVARKPYPRADFTNIDRIIVPLGGSAGVHMVRVFPSLEEKGIPIFIKLRVQLVTQGQKMMTNSNNHLRKCSIIPNVTMMRKTVMDISQFPLFDILLNRVQRIFGRYLYPDKKIIIIYHLEFHAVHTTKATCPCMWIKVLQGSIIILLPSLHLSI